MWLNRPGAYCTSSIKTGAPCAAKNSAAEFSARAASLGRSRLV
jgi:hypothetical protein